jgi:hypothetical protein
MGIPSVRSQRCGRALFTVLALVANLFATGVPLLHALAHERGHAEAHVLGHEHTHRDHHAPSHQGDEHDEIHPAGLHDECLVLPRAALDLDVALVRAVALDRLDLGVTEAPSAATSALHSRAPPRAPSARAPPLV